MPYLGVKIRGICVPVSTRPRVFRPASPAQDAGGVHVRRLERPLTWANAEHGRAVATRMA